MSSDMMYMCYCHSLGFTVGSGSEADHNIAYELISQFGEFINPIRKGEFLEIETNNKLTKVTLTPTARIIDFLPD